MSSIAPYAKAIIGALVAGLASLQQALDDGTMTAQEWTGVAIATLSGLALVWAIPNKDPEAEHQNESVQPPRDEVGAVDMAVLLLVAILAAVVLILFGVRL